MSPRDLILHFGYDAQLSEARGIILEDAGYNVALVDTQAAAIRVLKTQRVRLVVACHSVPPDELAAAVQQMKRVRPGVPIVLVHVGGLVRPQRSNADGFIDGLRGPEHLLSQVAGVITRNRTTAAS